MEIAEETSGPEPKAALGPVAWMLRLVLLIQDGLIKHVDHVLDA